MHKFTILIPLVLLASLAAAPADWPHYHGPGYDRKISDPSVRIARSAEEWSVKWRVELGVGYSAVTVADNACFTIGNSQDTNTVYCLDRETGTERWTYRYACRAGKKFAGPRAAPTIADGRVYTFSRSGHLHCFSVEDGTCLWTRNVVEDLGGEVLRFGLNSQVLIREDRAYLFAGGEAGLVCLEAATGRLIWNHGPAEGDQGYGSPLFQEIGRKLFITCSTDNLLWGIDPETTETAWTISWPTRFGILPAAPLVRGSELFISSNYGTGCAKYDLRSGTPEQIWRNKNMQSHFNTAILHGDYIFGPSGDIRRNHALQCVNWLSGDLEWSVPETFGPVIMVNGLLVVLTTGGELVLCEPDGKKYAEIARKKLLDGECWTSPTYSRGIIYGRTATGGAVAIDITER